MRSLAVAVTLAAILGIGACTATEPQLGLLEQPAGSQDHLPDGTDAGPSLHAIRFVGDTDDASVYAARGPAGRPWCVLVVLDDGANTVGSSCADDSRFLQDGVEVDVSGAPGRYAAARLLPDDFHGALPSGWEVVSPNLAAPKAR